MRYATTTAAAAIAATLIITPAMAGSWDTQVEAGGVRTGGNTSTQTLNAKLQTIYHSGRWQHAVRGSAVNNSSSGSTSAERYSASLKTEYKAGNLDYIFGRYAFDSDRFTGYRRRHSESAGYGHYFLRGKNVEWKGELGAGARQTIFVAARSEKEFIGRSATYLKWKISDTARFEQELETEGGRKNWVSNSVTSLTNKINGNLSSKITLSLEHNSRVEAGKKKLDSEISISFVYAFADSEKH